MSKRIFFGKIWKSMAVALLFSVLFSGSAWAALSQTEVSQLYVAIFGRASEGEGNVYWRTDQPDIIATANQMLSTEAAQNYFGDSLNSNQAFIEHIYLNTLSKTYNDDPVGIAYWVSQLEEEGKSRGEVSVALVGVIKEYAPDGAYYDPDDAKTIAAYKQFTNRVEVSNYMADTVDTAPSDWAVSTSFTGSLTVTDSDTSREGAKGIVDTLADQSPMAEDIRYYLGMTTAAGDLAPMMDEMTTLLSEVMSGSSSVVTITPPLETLDMENPENLPSTISIVADFGAGYTPQGGTAVFTGNLSMNITNIAMSETGMSANASMTATNVTRDGQLVLDGGMTLSLDMQQSESGASVLANVNFSNLQSVDNYINGGISMSMTMAGDTLSQPVTVTFDELKTKDTDLSGTITVTPVSEQAFDIALNMTTNKGPVSGVVRMEATASEQIMISTPSGALTLEDYTMTINSVVMDDTACSQWPLSGNVVISGDSETKTVSFSNCAYTIN